MYACLSMYHTSYHSNTLSCRLCLQTGSVGEPLPPSLLGMPTTPCATMWFCSSPLRYFHTKHLVSSTQNYSEVCTLGHNLNQCLPGRLCQEHSVVSGETAIEVSNLEEVTGPYNPLQPWRYLKANFLSATPPLDTF